MLNQLATTTMPNNSVITNTYNGEGLRVAKNVDSIITRYLYEYDKVVLEEDVFDIQLARNVYGTNLIMRNAGYFTGYYFYNGHADVTAITDNLGNTLGTYYYDAFGNILEHTGAFNSNVTYAGYQYDAETGKYYLVSRMYDPIIARFLQEDTYRGDKNDPLSLNLYTYCHNEPLMYWDYDGHMASGDSKYLRFKSVIDKLVSATLNLYYKKTSSQYNPTEVRKTADVQMKIGSSVTGETTKKFAGTLNYYLNKYNFGANNPDDKLDNKCYNFIMQVPQIPNVKVPKGDTSYINFSTSTKDNNPIYTETIQYRLKELGYFDHSVTGFYGNITDSSIRAFQKNNNMPETGVVDEETFKKLLLDDNVVANKDTVYSLASTDKERLSEEQQKANAQYINDYLSQQGWSKEAICGLLGNIEQESHLNPGVWQKFHDTELGYGLVQWDDATKFLNWAELNTVTADNMAKDNPKQLMDFQLAFLTYTSKSTTQSVKREWFATTKFGSPYSMNYEQYIVSTKDAGNLALVFHASYERSADDEKRKQNRVDYAKKWYDYFNK